MKLKQLLKEEPRWPEYLAVIVFVALVVIFTLLMLGPAFFRPEFSIYNNI